MISCLYQWIITTFFQASISVLGGFFPIFGLMYIHYRIRKSFYRKTLPIYQQFVDFSQMVETQTQERLNVIYQSFGVNNMGDLLKTLSKAEIFPKDLVDEASRLEREKSEQELETMKDKSALDKLRNYTFKDYLVGILNKNYPDSRF